MKAKNKLTSEEINNSTMDELKESIREVMQERILTMVKVKEENIRQEKKYHVLESVFFGGLCAYVVGGLAVVVNLLDPAVDLSSLEKTVSTLGVIGGGGIIGGIKRAYREKKEKYGSKFGKEYQTGKWGMPGG